VDRSLSKVRRIESLCSSHGFAAVKCVAADSRYLCSGAKAESHITVTAAGPEALASKCELPSQQLKADIAKPSDDEVLDATVVLDAAHCNDNTWSDDVEKAFLEAVDAHGTDRFRSHKRIWKAVIAKVGRGQASRLQVQARLRRLAAESTAASCTGIDIEEGNTPPYPPEFFDCILVDAPCSAMGQRPLLRWGKNLAEVCDHAEYQRHFLRTASHLLRTGGTLVYSTCTLTAEENEENVSWALASLPLKLEDARAAVFQAPPGHSFTEMSGWAGCGLSAEERLYVLRFDPRVWDVGFFLARFRKL
jgi:hypothetical protein